MTDPQTLPSAAERPAVRYLVFSASLRKASLNTRLAGQAAAVIEAQGGVVDRASMHDFVCPAYDQDVEDNEGMPEGAARLREMLLRCDAFVLASPEYNGSVPGVLKNTIDWVSRYRPQPFHGRHALLLSASPSMAGGNHGLWALRRPLEKLGTHVAPAMFSLATAHQAMDVEGAILDATLAKRFRDTIHGFMELVEAVKHYPCAKRVWVEFLGERPEPDAG
jgi:chromate reductase